MSCDEHIHQSLQLSSVLLEFASEVRLECDHDTCAILDGVIRDSARRIALAVHQCTLHVPDSTGRAHGPWSSDDTAPGATGARRVVPKGKQLQQRRKNDA